MTWRCPFCAIVAGDAPATVLQRWPDAIAITPLHPVTPGHALVIPHVHVQDAAENPAVTAATVHRAAQFMVNLGDANIITSKGAAATQTVFHLHVHVVPRQYGDGLPLPWTPRRPAGSS